jgi:hypothetical protein
MPNISSLPVRLNVFAAQQELESCSGWNLWPHRKSAKRSPHRECDDIWVRFQTTPTREDGSFDCGWYDVADELPAIVDLCNAVEAVTGAVEMGGVLITRIPAGKQVYPHADFGWHAEHYEKYAVQIKGNADQRFYFDDSSLSPDPGDLYTFVNQHRHWVRNDSTEERITLICCLRTH